MEIQQSDLMASCKHCEGAGKLALPNREHVVGLKEFSTCPECSGSGVILTESGESILALLEKINLRERRTIPWPSAS